MPCLNVGCVDPGLPKSVELNNNIMTTPSSRQPRRRCTLDVIILFVTLALLSSLNCIPTVSAGVDTERKQAVVDALGEVQIEEPFEDIDGGATTSSISISATNASNSSANEEIVTNPECDMQPNFFSIKPGTGCKEYIYCEKNVLISTISCPDGLLFNGMFCDNAEEFVCTM